MKKLMNYNPGYILNQINNRLSQWAAKGATDRVTFTIPDEVVDAAFLNALGFPVYIRLPSGKRKIVKHKHFFIWKRNNDPG